MSIRRPLPALAALVLLSAGCGNTNSAKGSPGDAVGMGSAEGAAAGTSAGTGASGEVTESLGPGQDGTAANDTVPHRPAP